MSLDDGGPVRGGDLGPDEHAELDRLRTEVARLRAATPPPTGGDAGASTRRGGGRARTAGAVVALVLACVLACVSVVGVWVKSQVFDTDRYVETVAPLADDPAVQQMVTQRITNEIFSHLDIEKLTSETFTALQQTLPPRVGERLPALAGVAASGVESFVHDQVSKVVASPAFADAWVAANRAAHDQLVKTLSGEGRALQVNGATVSVRMDAFVNVVKKRLVNRGFALAGRIPQVNAEFVILKSDKIPQMQRGFHLLDFAGTWLPFVTLAVFAAGICLARNRRRALVGAALGLALTMLVIGIALTLVRTAYLNAVPPDAVPGNAAAAIYDTVIRFLREAVRAVGFAAVVIAVGALLVGPARAARVLRQGGTAGAAALSRGISSLGVNMAAVSRRVAPHARWVRIVLAILAIVAFVVPLYPTPMLVLWIVIGLLAALLVLQVLSAPGRRVGSS